MEEAAKEKSPISVLLLENDPMDAELCEAELRRAGMKFRAEVVQTPDDFHARLDGTEYDVILADYNLPGWTGVDAFEYVRSKRKDIPFILVTGAVGDEAAVECIKSGICDYVLKDRLVRLPVAIRRALEEKALREETALAERRLIEKDLRFRALVEHSADGIVLLNSRGEVIFTSHSQNQILGYSAKERMGKSVFELVHPDDAAQAMKTFRSLVEGPGGSAIVQMRYLSKAGSWRWLECIANNLLAEPSVQGVVINYRDISERKQAEEEIRRLNDDLERRVAQRTAQLEAANKELHVEIAERRRAEKILKESQERFRLLVDGVRDYAIYMLDPQGRIVSWNAGAERIKGYRAEEIIGRHFSCFYTLEDIEQNKPKVDLATASAEGRLEKDGRRIRKDGSTFWANFVLTALHDSSGRLKGFSIVTRDITEQRLAHEALEHLQLQRELILNSAGDGICGLDQEGRCTFINPAGALMLGWQPEELTGKYLHDVLHDLRGDATHCDKEHCQLQAALKNGTALHSAEGIFSRGNGMSVAVDSVITPIRSDDGHILGAVLAFRDVTERRAVERMKDEFISVVSHELRTPLTAIRGSLGLLASGRLCQNKSRCQKMAAVGVANADRLGRLVNDMLDLERIESGLVAMEKKLCDSAELMGAAVDLMRVSAKAHGITLSLGSFSTSIRVDPDRITQVLINLLGNAIKFSVRGSEVRLTAARCETEIVFEVADHGRGIPASKLSRIFERFQQVDASDSREKGGTGLGLAICRTIVAQHGGRIWVESALGQGSRFFFSLPLQGSPGNPLRGARQDASENLDC